MRSVPGLPLVLLSTLFVLVVGVAESWSGLATVADAGTVLLAMLLLVTLVTLVVRFSGDRSAAWRVTTLGALAVVATLLAVVMVVVTFRGHTASSRFADRMNDLPLLSGYEVTSADQVDRRHQRKPEHVVRAWTVPEGGDPCDAIATAFRTWADPPLETFSRGGTCTISSNDQDEKAEIHVSADNSTVVLEMWLEGSSLITF